MEPANAFLKIEVSTSTREAVSMTNRTISPLRQRMVEDMNARQLGPHSQRSHIYSCERFAAFLKRSPDTATAEDVRRFQLHLMESGASISNRNRIMTGVKFLLRVTLRRLDLVAEIYHLKEPQRLPLVMSPVKRLATLTPDWSAILTPREVVPVVHRRGPRRERARLEHAGERTAREVPVHPPG